MSNDCPIIFDPIKHSYTRKSDGKIFTSVTTHISKYKPKNPFEKIAERIASKRGTTKDVVLNEWDEIKNKGLDFGTRLHGHIQNYMTGTECDPILIPFLKKMQNDHRLQDKKILSEVMVYDLQNHIAGTADLIAEYMDNNFFEVIDYKTNKKFSYGSSNWEDGYFSDPISHLPCNEYFTYALQLSMYAHIFSKMSGKKPSRLTVYWLKRKNTKDYESFEGIWKKIGMPYLEEEVISLLNNNDGKEVQN
ncbi:MAG: hypothetical protein EBR82_51660 [Caulobacteraceae bacterium]|nr:hypothetical protein [Caulobacteraceae bacterium]